MTDNTVQNIGIEAEAKAAMDAQPDQMDQMDQIETKQITPRESGVHSLKDSRVLASAESQTTATEIVVERVVRPPSEVTQDLLNLHAKLDQALSQTYLSSQTKYVPASIETILKASPSITGVKSMVYETAYSSPVRTVRLAEEQTVRSAPFSQYAATSHYNNPFNKSTLSYSAIYSTSSTFKPGYDKDKFDKIVEGIVSRQHSYNTIRSATIRPANESVYVREVNLTRDREVACPYHMPNKRAVAQKERDYYCGEVQNDRDSIVLDYMETSTKEMEGVKNNPEYYTDELVDDEEEKPRTKKVGKKQEASSPKKPTQYGGNKNNNNEVFVAKGPYDQKKRDKMTPEQAKKHFEQEHFIDDFDFGKNRSK